MPGPRQAGAVPRNPSNGHHAMRRTLAGRWRRSLECRRQQAEKRPEAVSLAFANKLQPEPGEDEPESPAGAGSLAAAAAYRWSRDGQTGKAIGTPNTPNLGPAPPLLAPRSRGSTARCGMSPYVDVAMRRRALGREWPTGALPVACCPSLTFGPGVIGRGREGSGIHAGQLVTSPVPLPSVSPGRVGGHSGSPSGGQGLSDVAILESA